MEAGSFHLTGDETMSCTLSCWSGLTSLSLDQQIAPLLRDVVSTKTSLQELNISPVVLPRDATSGAYAFMPISLTALTIADSTLKNPSRHFRDMLAQRDNVPLTLTTWPEAGNLSQLRRLKLVHMHLDPAVLKCFTNLQQLTLEKVQPLRPTDDDE